LQLGKIISDIREKFLTMIVVQLWTGHPERPGNLYSWRFSRQPDRSMAELI